MNLCLGSTAADYRAYTTACLIDTAAQSDGRDPITAVEALDANIYIGTSSGQLLHYHRFEDNPEFILLSQQDVRSEPVARISVVRELERILVLCGNTVNVYSFPEVSPIASGKLKDVEDIVLLRTKAEDQKAPYVDAIVLTKAKLRLIRMFPDQMKLIKDISYNIPITATSHGSNNLVTVANDKNYDIIDVENTRRVPLFAYVSEEAIKVRPCVVSFSTDDSHELLLTIASDKDTSIGMFINDEGDVVRGTLPWPAVGYPNGGVAVDWPYALGIHGAIGSAKTLVISSLKELEVKCTFDLAEALALAPESSEMSFFMERFSSATTFEVDGLNSIMRKTSIKESNNSSSSDAVLSSADILIYDEARVWALYSQNPLIQLTQAFRKLASGESPNENAILLQLASDYAQSSGSKTVKSYFTNIMFLHFLLHKDLERLQTNVLESADTEETSLYDIAYLVDRERQSDFWNEPRVFNGIKDVLDNVKVDDKSRQFLYSLLTQVYSGFVSKSKRLDSTCVDYLRYLIYGEFQSSEKVVEFVKSTDIDVWKKSYSRYLIKLLTRKGFFVAVVYLHSLVPLSELTAQEHKDICVLIAQLLNGSTIDSATHIHDEVEISVAGTKLNLVDTLLRHLSKVEDPKTYTDCLMEVFRLQQEKGIAYMKKDINGMHKSSYGQILKDVYKAVQSEDFAHLKLEYLENTLREAIKNGDDIKSFVGELIDHLFDILKSAAFVNEAVVNNMAILYETYKIEHSLHQDSLNKISWIGFLQLTMNSTECKDFIDIYLKLYELLRHEGSLENQQRRSAVETLCESSIFEYFNIAFLSQEKISGFLGFHDFFSGEYFAYFGVLPPLNSAIYTMGQSGGAHLTSTQVKENLLLVYAYYKAQFEQDAESINGIRQFVKQYESWFTPLEIVDLLPENTSVVYFKQYLESMLVELGNKQRESLLRKTIIRREVVFNKQLYDDFTLSHESV